MEVIGLQAAARIHAVPVAFVLHSVFIIGSLFYLRTDILHEAKDMWHMGVRGYFSQAFQACTR
jgi:hypothetical protein